MLGKTEKVILALILFIGAILRIYNFWDFSLSNDELSALARLNFDSFSDLIMNGVRIDGHPAAAQVLLWYMTQWFGNGVFVVRLPFVVAGIVSVYFMFRLGKEWISTSAGLLSATAFATLEFPILYSRIARPYALGMLFTLMAATFWIRIVKKNDKPSDFIWLAISLALCAYSHYFAALVAAILAVTGTFLVKGKNLRFYLLALIGAFVLYLPYIPIFLHQLSLGGVGQWLGPPENDWLWKHIYYVFNESFAVLLSTVLIGSTGFFVFKPKISFVNHVLPLLLFLTPFLVGFFYSRNVNPVLQNSTLLFSFPFLLVFMFSYWDDGKTKLSKAAVNVLLVITLVSTVVGKQFYQTNHFGVFKELAELIVEWNDEVENDALLIGDFNFPFYIDYYIEKQGSTKLDLYRTTDENGLAELKTMVDTSTNEFLIYAWSTVNQVPEIEAVIKEMFPVEVKRKSYFNSEVMMFRRGNPNWTIIPFRFEKNSTWNFDPTKIRIDTTGINKYLMDIESPYGPTFSVNVDSLRDAGFSELTVYLSCSSIADSSEIQLVYEQENTDEKYSWESDPFGIQFNANSPNWGVFHYELKSVEGESGTLKIFPWSPKGERLTITEMEVRLL